MSPIRRDLRASTADAVFFSLMVGLGESYVPAFALALGLGPVWAGLLATAPLLVGAIFQVASPWGAAWLGSLRRWVVGCALLQAASFLPLAWGAVRGALPGWALFAAMAVYWGAGMATGPAWNTWIETLVPSRVRPVYFARRSRLANLAVLLSLLAGGVTLQLGQGSGWLLPAFGGMFLLAGACRVVSAGWLVSHRELSTFQPERRGPVQLVRSLSRGPVVGLLGLMLSLQLAVQLSAPYFTPYMLEELQLSYLGYTCLTAAALVARVASLPLLGRLARARGARWLLLTGSLGVTPIALLWSCSGHYGYLLALQVGSGLAWGAYELATFLLFFETIPRSERLPVLTAFNLLNAGSLVGGSLLGGALLTGLGVSGPAYLALFGLSSLLRAGALLFLLRVPDSRLAFQPLATRTLAVRPAAGLLERPVVAGIPTPGEEPPPRAID